jgi:hypothetical protein
LKPTLTLLLWFFVAGQLYGQHQIAFLQLSKNDSLAKALEGRKFTVNEQKYHQLIWRLKTIRQEAIVLTKKGVVAFTMTDDWPSPDSEYYIISFYEMILNDKAMDRYSRLQTYRISRRMKIERYDPEEDSWVSLTPN